MTKRTHNAGALLLTVGALVLTTTAARADDAAPQEPAQNAPAKGSALDEAISVVARGYAGSAATATPKVTRFTEADIAARQATTVSEMLSEVPGVYVLPDGPRGQFTRIFTRGAASTQTLVLVDGIPQNDATTGGGYDFNDLSTAGVASIEVLEGSYGVLYGSEAIGGVVAVTTRRGKGDWRGFSRLEGGSFGTRRAVVGAGGGDDEFDLWVTLSHDQTSGERKREDFDANEFDARLGFEIASNVRADWSVRSAESRVESPFDFPGFGATVLPPDGNIERDRHTLSLGVTVTADFAEWVTARVTASYLRVGSGLRNGTDGPETIDPDFTPNSGDEFRVTRDELISKNEARDLRLRGAATLEVSRKLGWSRPKDGGFDLTVTAGGETLSQASDSRSVSPNFNAAGSSSTSVSRDLGTDSLFALAELGLPDSRVTNRAVFAFGARYDDHETFGGESSPYAGIRFDVPKTDTTLRGSYGQGFRAPKPAELDDPFVGNLALGAETSTSYDVGVAQRFFGGNLEVGATWFRLDVDDLIAYDGTAVTPTRPFGQLVNLGSTRTDGVEFESTAELGAGFSFRGAFTNQNPRDRSTGLALSNRARHFASGGLAWERGALRLGLDANWSSKLPAQGGEFSYPEGDERKAPGRRTLINLTARYKASEHVTVFGRIENLLDDDWVATPTSPAGTPLGAFVGVQLDF